MFLNNALRKVSMVRVGAGLLLLTAAVPSLAVRPTNATLKSTPKVRIAMCGLTLSTDELRNLKLNWKKMNTPLSLETQTNVRLPQREGPPLPESIRKKDSAKPTAAVLSRAALESVKVKHPEIRKPLQNPLILPSNTLLPFSEAAGTFANGALTTEYEHVLIRPRVNAKENTISLELETKSPLRGKSGIVLNVRSGDSVLVRDSRGIFLYNMEIAK